MAKRYIKLNWQNRPSVATPVSAENLNKMDKGIDDVDNAIEEIYAKRVNNTVTTNPDTFLAGPVGKDLQDQITEQNNNLAFTKVVSKSYLLQGQEDIQLSSGLFLVVAQISLVGSPASVSLVGVTGSIYSITKLHENMNITLSKAGTVLSVAMVGGYQWDLRVYKLV